jgi:hypothetical protein
MLDAGYSLLDIPLDSTPSAPRKFSPNISINTGDLSLSQVIPEGDGIPSEGNIPRVGVA